MDTITHGVAGALLGKAFFASAPVAEAAAGRRTHLDAAPTRQDSAGADAQPRRIAIVAAMFAAIAPDGDVFFSLFNSSDLAGLELHRGWTHSLVCLPLIAVALAGMWRLLARRFGWAAPPFRALVLINAVALASHILFDLITSYGTMIWSPLANTRAAWDLVFIIDFTFSAIVLAPQVAAWVYRSRRGSTARALAAWAIFALGAVGVEKLARSYGVGFSPWVVVVAAGIFGVLFFAPLRKGWGFSVSRARWCRAGVYALGAYLLLCAGAHQMALARVKDFAAARGLAVEHLGALPMPPSLVEWSGLIRAADGVYHARFRLTGGTAPEFAFEADAPHNRYIEAARALPETRTYLWFARFPVVRYAERDGFHTVEFYDLRFTTGGILRRRTPFTFRVTLDSGGAVVSHGWAND
jgi:membrane-bound metal-dependent hydrolase YbcI (DUF457 family)